jgi:K+-transporting ATPase ATPase C chain
MIRDILRQMRPAAVVFVLLSLITGVVYPLVVSGIAWELFPSAAQGSLISRDGRVIGSKLIGQSFDDEKYFWSRPSATIPAYNAGASSGSNLGPTNPALMDAVKERVTKLKATADDADQLVPVDLVTASASGLDPHISPAAAYYQVSRIARARGVSKDRVEAIVEQHIEPRLLGIIGEPRVNVLLLNLALDETMPRAFNSPFVPHSRGQ